jgi:hypothetical protein
VDEIRSCGQTIVYSVHESIGHLGIFVSGGVARKEHGEFASNIDLIDTLPPGLYEAIFTPKSESGDNADLVSGAWIMRCEARTLDDIRALNGNRDDRLFAAAAQVSKANLALYQDFVQPLVRAVANPAAAKMINDLHPLRLQYSLFSSKNPFMAPVPALAAQAKQDRKPVNPDNPLLRLQELFSKQVTAGFDLWRDMRDSVAERMFLTVYSTRAVQAAAGLHDETKASSKKAARNPLHQQMLDARIAELKSRISTGGLHEALIRSALYIGMIRGRVDERGFGMIKRIRESREGNVLSLAEFKKMVREQFFMLLLDQKAAVGAIPALLPADPVLRRDALDLIQRVLSASGELKGEAIARLEEVRALFSGDAARAVNSKDGLNENFQSKAM